MLALGLFVLAEPAAAAPPDESPEAGEASLGSLRGRVRLAGRRTPMPGIKLLIVDAPDDVRPGRPARHVLAPEDVTWIREAETDAEGRFSLDDVPVGKVRVVIVAPGYRRLEQWAEATSERAPEIDLWLEPEDPTGYRTEVVTSVPGPAAEPEHELDAEQIRVYPGSGNDPVRATQNLPGIARSPGGLGLMAIRGGDPRQTGIFLDGHPIPRAFHVLPVASVLSPGVADRIELTLGNYDAAYGGYAGGLLHLHSKPGSSEGVHGEAHLDLFDLGATIGAPVGPGSVVFGARRSHVDSVIGVADRVIGDTGIILPVYWDYFSRFDLPLARGHQLTLRALGAGDRLRDEYRDPLTGEKSELLDFSAAFHRFDLAYALERGRTSFSISPALRLDDSRIEQEGDIKRINRVFSLRSGLAYELTRSISLLAGADLIAEQWRQDTEVVLLVGAGDESTSSPLVSRTELRGRSVALGLWFGFDLHVDGELGVFSVRPQARLNLFHRSFEDNHDLDETQVRADPRLDVRWAPAEWVELHAALGLYSAPVIQPQAQSLNAIPPQFYAETWIADVPDYLITYFDPGIQGEGRLRVSRTLQASLAAELELPWSLRLRTTGFWRETPQVPARNSIGMVTSDAATAELGTSLHNRAYGLELMLARTLARDIHGWIGYSLLRAQVRWDEPRGAWYPTSFDQRHNLIFLLSFSLPRNFRFGVRFRLVSGNPMRIVVGSDTVQTPYGTGFRPVRADRGVIDPPLFHQLDLRLDKTWHLKRASVGAYLDVQNVYNVWHPEIYVYTGDWQQRSQLIGLPIFPSLGVRVDY